MPRRPSNATEVMQAVNCFIRNDEFLLGNNVSERAITHKLAEHLQLLLPEWDIDCEYNRKLGGPKTIDFRGLIERMMGMLTEESRRRVDYSAGLPETIRQLAQELRDNSNWLRDENGNSERYVFLSGDDNAKYVKHVYPDIIAHRRGSMINKIVIEVKIEGRRHNTDKNRLFDLAKLAALTDPRGEYKYGVGFFVTLPNTVSANTTVSTPIKNSYLDSVISRNHHKVYDINVD